MNVKNKIVISFGLVAYLLSLVLGIEGAVLCLGQDGHVEVETALADSTCGTSAPTRGVHADISTEESASDKGHCGPCKDIPLALTSPVIFDSISSHTEKAQYSAIKVLPVKAPIFAQLPIANTLPKDRLSSLGRHSSLATLRTVILLI